jgi:hypothetical protein
MKKYRGHVLDLLIGAVIKLEVATGERENVMAFIQSCYGGRVRTYDLDAAMASLAKLTDEEQHALITWTLLEAETGARCPSPARV